MLFCDRAKILISSGAGGKGCVSFRREKNVPFGGADGGHGGKGGSVWARACADVVTLIDFHYRSHLKAKDGQPGQGRRKAGASAPDLILKVPVGTEIWAYEECVADLVNDQQDVLLLKGGQGGRGNTSFKSAHNQAPRQFEPGEPQKSLCIILKLKLLADVGLIGLPNAGKSSLIQALTHSSSLIAPYPFTTLSPQLGAIVSETQKEIILADLPGLIEGAHQGKGLGHLFLGHAERCGALLHVIDGTLSDIASAYHLIRAELGAYNPQLLEKKEIIVINKCDKMSDESIPPLPSPPFVISALTGQGIHSLKTFLGSCVDRLLKDTHLRP